MEVAAHGAVVDGRGQCHCVVWSRRGMIYHDGDDVSIHDGVHGLFVTRDRELVRSMAPDTIVRSLGAFCVFSAASTVANTSTLVVVGTKSWRCFSAIAWFVRQVQGELARYECLRMVAAS